MPRPAGTLLIQRAKRILFGVLLIPLFALGDWDIYDADGALRIGPVETRTVLDLLRSRLDANSIPHELEDRSFDQSMGFIVVTEPYANKASAQDDLDELSLSGVKDYLYVGRGVYIDRISVGVFGSLEAASARVEEMASHGFMFRVLERTRSITSVELVILDPDLTSRELERVLAGEILDSEVPPEPVTQPAREAAPLPVPASDLAEGEIRIEPSAESISEPIQEPVEAESPIAAPQLINEPQPTPKPEPNTEPLPTIETGTQTPVDPVSTPPVQLPAKEPAFNWLWLLFVGVALIVLGALAYYYLQRRKAEAHAREMTVVTPPAEASTDPEPESQPASGPKVEEAEPVETIPTEQLIEEYAASVLEGRAGGADNRSLTILGSENTRVTDLIQDLLFLNRLDNKEVQLEEYAFDYRSMIDNLISRLQSETGASVMSSPAESLPASIAMDASMLKRIITILAQYAIARTESGVISFLLEFENSQLITEMRFHPSGDRIEDELNTITLPAANSSNLNINDRVKFGVANRLAKALDGRIDARLDDGEALISIRCPAREMEPPQLVLPDGKSIDELLAAEAKAVEEIEIARKDAELKVTEYLARAEDAEQHAAESIHAIKTELSGLEAQSEQRASDLKQREDEIQNLQSQLQISQAEHTEQLNNFATEKTAAESELEQATTELTATREKLQEELAVRAELERSSQEQLAQLQQSLTEAQAKSNEAMSEIATREQAAQGEVSRLKAEMAQIQMSKDAENSEALEATRLQLEEATNQLQREVTERENAEASAEAQVKELLTLLSEAKESAEAAQTETSNLEEQLNQAVSELASVKTDYEQKAANADAAMSASQADVEKLTTQLKRAAAALREAQSEHAEAQAAANSTVEQLKADLKQQSEENETSIRTEQQKLSEATDNIAQLQTELENVRVAKDAGIAEQIVRVEQTTQQIERLTASLNEAQSELAEARENRQEAALQEEVKHLQRQLEQASEQLQIEVTRRNTAETAAGGQIDGLLDELNQLRMAANDASSRSQEIEAAGEAQVTMLRSELVAAQSALEEEQSHRSESEKNSAAAIARIEARSLLLEQEKQQLAAEVERAKAYGEVQTQMLEQVMGEAQDANATSEDLKNQIIELEKALARAVEAQPPAAAIEDPKPELVAEPAPEPLPEPEPEFAPEPEPIPDPATQIELEAEPSAEVEEPSAQEKQPSAEVEEPSAQEKQPSAQEKQPSAEVEEPSAETEEPLAEVKEPSAEEEEPSAEIPASAVDEPQDISKILPPLEEDEEPSAELPASAVDEPQDISKILPPLEEDEEPSAEPPATTVEEPQDISKILPPIDEDEELEEVEFQFDDKPIRSSRPVSNPILRAMTERFVDRLFEHLDTMEESLANRDYLELVVSCNWVRGEANTLGFEVLTGPITSIEYQLRREKFSQVITHLSELRNMAERIEIKHAGSADEPIQYIVPAHAKNAIIYENFVSQLGSKLLEMEVAAGSQNLRQMTQVSRWIDRYATKIKFVEVVDANAQLLSAIDSEDPTQIDGSLQEFISLYSKIEIVKPDPVDEPETAEAET